MKVCVFWLQRFVLTPSSRALVRGALGTLGSVPQRLQQILKHPLHGRCRLTNEKNHPPQIQVALALLNGGMLPQESRRSSNNQKIFRTQSAPRGMEVRRRSFASFTGDWTMSVVGSVEDPLGPEPLRNRSTRLRTAPFRQLCSRPGSAGTAA